MTQRIPKIIHYCWFGGAPMPKLARKCLQSWKKYCPDYEIRCWNEENFNLHYNTYVREAYEAKKWAFVADVARLHALVNHGGIYLDTDVELLRSPDDLLHYEAVSGFEAEERLQTGFMACRPGHEMFRLFLEDYNNRRFIREDGRYDVTTNVERITRHCLAHGLVLNNSQQTLGNLMLFPYDYFCPKDWATAAMRLSENTYAIHHFNGSWKPAHEVYLHDTTNKCARYIARNKAVLVATFLTKFKFEGFRSARRWWRHEGRKRWRQCGKAAGQA